MSAAFSERRDANEIEGMSAVGAVKMLFLQTQSEKVNCSLFGEEFIYSLSKQKLRNARAKLKSFGEPTEVKVLNRPERG